MDKASGEGDAVGSRVPTLEDAVRWVLGQPAPARSLSELLDLASVGIVLHAWRNSPLEDAHASDWCPLSDGEMMRTNAATTRVVREFLMTFLANALDVSVPRPTSSAPLAVHDTVADADALASEDLDEFDDADLLVEELLGPLHVALVRRVLPCGHTVAEATGEFFDELDDHVAQELDTFAYVTETYGLRAALYLKAIAGTSQQWWLTPAWPGTVAALRIVLADSGHRHWDIGGYPELSTWPDRCADIDQLVDVLYAGPDRLTAAEARWCVQQAGIGFVRHQVE
ncbi:hypothetical protein [Haloechinothrix salitolerans]|uniref:DUF4253 domain-containing protein n=1 Tax=Haloechinothrix salitolerans TaxID=926830 RepID=A0ABW2C2Z8_9PSEU